VAIWGDDIGITNPELLQPLVRNTPDDERATAAFRIG
jgi:hypothetical protein